MTLSYLTCIISKWLYCLVCHCYPKQILANTFSDRTAITIITFPQRIITWPSTNVGPKEHRWWRSIDRKPRNFLSRNTEENTDCGCRPTTWKAAIIDGNSPTDRRNVSPRIPATGSRVNQTTRMNTASSWNMAINGQTLNAAARLSFYARYSNLNTEKVGRKWIYR